MFATVANTESNARISSAETILPLTFNNSTFESLNACASNWSSSIINKLLERSKSLSYSLLLITSAYFSATSELNLLLATWHTLRFLLCRIPSASFKPAKSSSWLLLILNSFRFLTLETKANKLSPAYVLMSFWFRYSFSSF